MVLNGSRNHPTNGQKISSDQTIEESEAEQLVTLSTSKNIEDEDTFQSDSLDRQVCLELLD